MISAWHLVWIIPFASSFGLLVSSLLFAAHDDEDDEDDEEEAETEDEETDDEDDDGSGEIWGDRICSFLIGVLVGMAGMGVAIYFMTNDFATLFT